MGPTRLMFRLGGGFACSERTGSAGALDLAHFVTSSQMPAKNGFVDPNCTPSVEQQQGV